MRLRELLLFLVTMVCLALSPGIDRSARTTSRPIPGRSSVEDVPTSVSSPSPSPAISFSRPSHWRHRIKTVLEETDARDYQPVDLGPIVIPDDTRATIRSAPSQTRSYPLIPLRC
jgi:hypothetical protein